MRRFVRIAAGVLFACGAGCTVGPDYHPPGAPKGAGYASAPLPKATASAAVRGGAAQRFVEGLDIPGVWWTLFHSPPLDALVRQALAANPTIAAAQAALARAREEVYAAEGAFYPSVAADFAASRNQTAASQSPVPANNQLFYSLYTPEVMVGYAPDVFGGTRREVERREAKAEVERFRLEAAYLSLSANVVASAIEEAALRGEIDARREVVGIAGAALGILEKQYALGQIAGADVAAQQAALAQAEAALPPLEKALAQQRDRLAALLGRFPNRPPAESFDLASLTLPTRLPVSLPSQLVAHRPDMRAAAAELHAASAEIGVAVAAELPQFTLTANPGLMSLTLGGLGNGANLFWTVAGEVAQPIFEGFTLLHNKRAAEAAFAEAGARYRATTLGAFRDVADTLHALQSDAATLKAAVAAETAAKGSLDIARRQLQLGQIDYLGQLEAERTYARARLDLVRAEANRLADTAALFVALGGGWWNRHDLGDKSFAAR
jgi:NodT family efflux transporter outer membrane factor (OMF) lipoprotein